MTSPRNPVRRKQRCQRCGRGTPRQQVGRSPRKQVRKEALNLQVPVAEADSLAGLVSSLFDSR